MNRDNNYSGDAAREPVVDNPSKEPLSTPFLSVIVPAFNEEQRIGHTLNGLVEYLDRQSYTWELLIVDDGSTDATAAIAIQRAKEFEAPIRVESVSHAGKGWAVRHGMLAASGEYRFMCDADLAMPIEQLGGFLEHMAKGYEVVIGSRQIEGARRFDESLGRHAMGRVFNWSVRLLAVSGFQDTQCGFKCFRGDVAEELFRQQRTKGFGFDVELLYMAVARGLRVLEFPIDWHHRESSKVRPFVDTFLMLRDTVWLSLRAKQGKYKSDAGLKSSDQS